MHSAIFRSALPVLASLTIACSSAVATGQGGPASQAEQEERVWSAVLSTIAEEDHERIVVQDSADLSVPDSYDRQWIPRQLPDLRQGTFESFVRANTTLRAMPHFADPDIVVEHATAADLAAYSRGACPDEYWRRFYARYPRSPGLVRLSRVGFDPAHEQALVFVYHICGGRCGTGRYVLLSRSGEEWKVVGELAVLVH